MTRVCVPPAINAEMNYIAWIITSSYRIEQSVEEARRFLENRDSTGRKLLDPPVPVPSTDEDVVKCIMDRAGTCDLRVPDMLAWRNTHIVAGWTFDEEDMWNLEKETFETNEDVLEDIVRRSLIQHLVIRCGGNMGFAALGCAQGAPA